MTLHKVQSLLTRANGCAAYLGRIKEYQKNDSDQLMLLDKIYKTSKHVVVLEGMSGLCNELLLIQGPILAPIEEFVISIEAHQKQAVGASWF